MRAHRSLNPEDVLRRGPGRVALMVASEFGRAVSGAEYREDVIAAFRRARELMGLLETVVLPADIASRLKPYYERCRERQLLQEAGLAPDRVRRTGAELAEAFNEVGLQLSQQV